MSLTMDSKQLVHMLNISYAALGCTMCSHVYISLCVVLYVATYATNITAVFHPTVIQYICMDGTTTKIDLSLVKSTTGPHFQMAGIQKAMQVRAAYQHFGPPAERTVALNAFTKPAVHRMTTKMCSGLTVLLFLLLPFPKLAFSAFFFQP